MRALWLVLLLATGCSRTLVDYETASYIVRTGDTLSAIAWRFGLDPAELAAWNGIRNPDLIRAGQRLTLRNEGRTAVAPRSGSARRASLPSVDPPADPAPAWAWPTMGRVVSVFGTDGELSSGVAIGGNPGQSVKAAAAGRVVYAGDGLIGYGQLVIIKHNETYLSAYGHNRRLLVTQGQAVTRGQPIAEMGFSPQRVAQLHFEIRRHGKPVDPLGYVSPGG